MRQIGSILLLGMLLFPHTIRAQNAPQGAVLSSQDAAGPPLIRLDAVERDRDYYVHYPSPYRFDTEAIRYHEIRSITSTYYDAEEGRRARADSMSGYSPSQEVRYNFDPRGRMDRFRITVLDRPTQDSLLGIINWSVNDYPDLVYFRYGGAGNDRYEERYAPIIREGKYAGVRIDGGEGEISMNNGADGIDYWIHMDHSIKWAEVALYATGSLMPAEDYPAISRKIRGNRDSRLHIPADYDIEKVTLFEVDEEDGKALRSVYWWKDEIETDTKWSYDDEGRLLKIEEVHKQWGKIRSEESKSLIYRDGRIVTVFDHYHSQQEDHDEIQKETYFYTREGLLWKIETELVRETRGGRKVTNSPKPYAVEYYTYTFY